MAKVVLNKGMSLDKALRIFNSMCEKEQILSTYRKKRFYVKPSDERREKKMSAIRKHKKNAAKERAKEERRERRSNR